MIRRAIPAAVLGATALVAAGCSRGPHAPALVDEPEYRNSQAGFRFLVPTGWTQVARAETPPGPAPEERLLVEYKLLNSDRPAGLQVACVDLTPDRDLETYLAGPSFGTDHWRILEPPENLSVNGVGATRCLLAPAGQRTDQVREVVAFRRKARVYLFNALYTTGDSKARQQVRRAVDSIVWKD